MTTLKDSLTESKQKLDALLTYANNTTGANDTNVGDAIQTLCAGYGRGGYRIDDLVGGSEPSGDIVTYATTLGSRLFYGSKITSIVAPNLTTIPSATFQGSESLTSVDMPSLKTIGINGVFADCPKLTHVNLPNLENLKSATFQGTFLLKDIWLPKVTVIEGVPFYGRVWNSSEGSVLKLGSKPTSVSTNFLSGFARTNGDVYVVWSDGEVAGAPWQAPTGTTIHYNTVFDADGNIISSDNGEEE